mmetsp:Transcript_1640/g.5806  ORF Transcript_1640/g.5806 Transcript_1640/m.5806 type:complete len:234 (-) Transcript_1640:336-1037(-)
MTVKQENDGQDESKDKQDTLGHSEGPGNERDVVKHDVGQRGPLALVGHAVVHEDHREGSAEGGEEEVGTSREQLCEGNHRRLVHGVARGGHLSLRLGMRLHMQGCRLQPSARLSGRELAAAGGSSHASPGPWLGLLPATRRGRRRCGGFAVALALASNALCAEELEAVQRALWDGRELLQEQAGDVGTRVDLLQEVAVARLPRHVDLRELNEESVDEAHMAHLEHPNGIQVLH